MKQFTYSIIIVLCGITGVTAQENNIVNGHVSTWEKDILIGASVLLYSVEDTTKIIDYSITNEKGEFLIHTLGNANKFLKISYVGFETKKIKLEQGLKYYNITLKESQIFLNEIVIASSRYKDTINLKNDTIKFSEDATLKDLLKDNGGIEITEDNGIKFMGVPINKILINKKLVFVNQNSLALENITSDMIDNIQIINNYKDKFNIDFDNFNEMILNVDTKDKFKGLLKKQIRIRRRV